MPGSSLRLNTDEKPSLERLRFVGGSDVREISPDTSKRSRELAVDLTERVRRRTAIPIRSAFVRSDILDVEQPPLGSLVSSGGRGGGTALKLYLALIWIYGDPKKGIEDIPARLWAELLDLEDPTGKGKRRVNAALSKLEQLNLLRVEQHRGLPPTLRLLVESGLGLPYMEIPSTARFKAPKADRDLHNYFKLPVKLWTEGHVQAMSAKALAMLLVLSESSVGEDGREIWWSNKRFEERYGLSRATRSEGSRELFARRLVQVRREEVTTGPSAFATPRMRNVYKLIGAAKPV